MVMNHLQYYEPLNLYQQARSDSEARSFSHRFICVDGVGTYCGLAVASVINNTSAPVPYLYELEGNYPLSKLEGFFRGEPSFYPIQVFTREPEMSYADIRQILNKAAKDHKACAFIFGFSADPRNWDNPGQVYVFI